MKLRQSYKSEFGVPRVDELERLGNAVASDESALQGVEDPKRLHGLDGSSPVRGGLGIGDRELRELVRRERRLSVGDVEDPAPEHEFANRIGEAAFRNGEALLNRKPRPLLVGGKEHLEGRIMGDLGEEGARNAENQNRLVAGLLRKRAAISRAGSVKLAATATWILAASALPAKPSQSSPKDAAIDLSLMLPPD